MRLLEDLISAEDFAAIDRVLESDNSRFDLLVSLAGLDPKSDFKFSDLKYLNLCGADLRGFDFSHSDLRHCIRNDNTILDETTILTGARIDWVEVDALPIVLLMQKVAATQKSDQRQILLSKLISEFGKTDHVILYMANAANQSQTLEQYLDYIIFLPPKLDAHQVEKLRATGQKLLKRKVAQSVGRTGREKTASLAVNGIVEKLKSVPGSLAETIFAALVEIVSSKQAGSNFRGSAFVEPKDLELAFARMGR